MLRVDQAAIIGGGFSGTLAAINLLRHGTARVILIERDARRLARGLAYGAAQDEHILNVRARNMSAFPDQPDHFAQWLERCGKGSPDAFATRRDYGAYLAGLLEDARRATAGRLDILTDAAVDVDPAGAQALVTLASGSRIAVDAAILAPGNLPPHDLPAFAGQDAPDYVRDPWSCDIAAGLDAADTVLLIGTGLTAMDCALTLDTAGFRGRILAISRRGLAPHSHALAAPFTPLRERPRETGAALIRAVRARAGAVGWRNAVDELRPFTQDLWRAADVTGRAAFLRHLRPFWDVHRHRLAPAVAARLDEMRSRGALTVSAGKIMTATACADGLEVGWRPRGEQGTRRLSARRVINCTGPLGDLARAGDALLRRLATRGVIRPDPLAIGIDVDWLSRAVARDGRSNERLFVLGPMTRGAHWEIVAVPDIRKQVWSTARYLTHSHWVEADGL